MKIDKKTMIIIVLAIGLVLTLIYFIGFGELKNYCDGCRQKGFDNAFRGIINEIKRRGNPIMITTNGDKLICDIVRE